MPEAAYLASLSGVQSDLRSVIQYCDYLQQHGPMALDFFVWEAMSVAAVIAYARCFNQGVRHPLPKDLFILAPEHLKIAHDYFIALRSKHIAHSVNDFEENTPVAQIGEHFRSGAEIEHIHVSQSRIVGLRTDDPALLKELATWIFARVDVLVSEEKVKLLPIVRSLSIEEIKSQGSWGPGNGGNRGTIKARRSTP